MMMMAGDRPPSNPTVQIPSWDSLYLEDPTAHVPSPVGDGPASTNGSDAFSRYEKALAALQRYLPSNRDDAVWAEDGCGYSDDFDVPVDAFSSDDFRMFDFKVKKCAVARSHDWTECPFAHPGEKARRRDPRKCHYSGVACPDFRRGACKRGDACEYAHGVFECWLHPSRYRTQPCKDGTHCRRRVCFFAHTPEQLRVLPNTVSPDASPSRLGHDSIVTMGLFDSSPKSTLYSPPPSSPTTGSPPLSPGLSMSLNSVNQLSESVRRLQLNKIKLGLRLSASPPSWGLGMGSPRKPPTTQPGFMSLPSTPIRAQAPPGISEVDAWGSSCEEEPAMERVESGKQLRERIYEKLVKENSLERLGRVGPVGGAGRLFGWVEEPGN